MTRPFANPAVNDGVLGVLLFVAAKNQLEIEGETRARGFDICCLGQRHTLAVADRCKRLFRIILKRSTYAVIGMNYLLVIITCVRWYLRIKLSYRDLAELARELGVSVAPSTVLRWVVRYVQSCVGRHDSPETPARQW